MTKAGEQPTITQAAIDAICSKFDSYTLDWDHSRQYDGEEPRVIPTCGELRQARQIILALSEAANARTTSLAAQDGLVEALEQIADPIGHMQQRAKDEGRKIDGHMAIVLSKDVEYLKNIARKALAAIKGDKS